MCVGGGGGGVLKLVGRVGVGVEVGVGPASKTPGTGRHRGATARTHACTHAAEPVSGTAGPKGDWRASRGEGVGNRGRRHTRAGPQGERSARVGVEGRGVEITSKANIYNII